VTVESRDQVSWTVEGSADQVVGWSLRRLQLEARGEMLAYLDALRAAIRAMSGKDGCGLVIDYVSRDPAKVDLDNVTLYNLDRNGCWRHLVHSGVACVRSSAVDGHRTHYRVAPMPSATNGKVLAQFSVDLPGRPPPDSPGWWWAAFKPVVRALDHAWAGDFTLDIEVSDTLGISPIYKPMLDGLVASLQAHDGSNRETLHLALAAFGDTDDLWNQVTDATQAVLGTRNFLLPRDGKLMWSPGDDRCCGFQIRRVLGAGNSVRTTVRAAPSHALSA
jgi:hypothetical protein